MRPGGTLLKIFEVFCRNFFQIYLDTAPKGWYNGLTKNKKGNVKDEEDENLSDYSHLKVYRLDESGMGYSLVHAKKIEGAPALAPEKRLIGFDRW